MNANIPDAEQALQMYKSMWRIRRFEQRFLELRDQTVARGGVAVAIGQEAVAVGVCATLRTNDYITSTHRGDGHCLAKGADPGRLMAEFLGRREGYCGGKGGPMHVAIPEIGVMGTNGIVGAGIPIANGLALAARKSGSDQVSVSFFGDGATNTGAFHEALNLAIAWQLPVIFVCENNFYAIATRITGTTGESPLYKRGEGLGMATAQVDGNDVLAVFEATKKAVERARRGEGPTFLECLTYRWEGWAWKDREKGLKHYRSEEEWQEWIEKCPIKRFKELLGAEGVLTTEIDSQIETEIEDEIEKAIEFALSSSEPEADELEKHVYA